MPRALMRRPELAEHLTFVWSAFWRLQADRAIGFGVFGPIRWTAIHAYAERYGITDLDEYERLERLVGLMDGEWRKMMDKKGADR
ncbi:hypothetical protein HNR00_003589 [Methylorubrum rhodinum]|uniref:Uncharacterized protein n=1 Tax=Methylorubrum rhodinum TaxID=29428 RepID=A0A840ZL72_9HYPH|nr:hypothetical protein [Methylorubrum rhodinum]MBB5758862.1 hypothetical protein [Methylorubrum rhodinum]